MGKTAPAEETSLISLEYIAIIRLRLSRTENSVSIAPEATSFLAATVSSRPTAEKQKITTSFELFNR